MKRLFIITALLVLVWSCKAQSAKLPEGFGYLKDYIPTAKLELRYFGSDNFLGKPVDGYKAELGILSVKALKALKEVQQELHTYGLSIKMYDGYRPQQAVDHFVRWARQLNDTITKNKFYPQVPKKMLFKEGYIASKSGHTRGSSIDLTLVDIETGEELDMGSPWDFFGPESWVKNPKLSVQQRANRMLLQTVMKKHGFKYYSKEWWHFTLRDEPFPETYFNFPIQ